MKINPKRIRPVIAQRGAVAALGMILRAVAAMGADDFPEFRVTGHEVDMARLTELYRLHHGPAQTPCALWDGWLPRSVLWAAVGSNTTAGAKRTGYRGIFLQRRIDAEGYVSMQQHRGLAHSEGWPFPAYRQSTGSGWHFSTLHDVWAIQHFKLQPLASADGWSIEGAEVEGIDPEKGLILRATRDVVSIACPDFQCGTIVAPFVRLEWAAAGLPPDARASVSWRMKDEPVWSDHRRVAFDTPPAPDRMIYSNIPLYRQPGYAGLVTGYRFTFERAAGARLFIKSLITAVDTRHPITNPMFIRGCADYIAWTGDTEFLRLNLDRMRRALRFALHEFSVIEGRHVLVPWVGHDGRSGLVVAPDGAKTVRPGLGVGNNYWDLLPFGGHDALATIYLYDAIRAFARIEREAAANPDPNAVAGETPFVPEDLERLADEIRADFGARFWNPETGRFLGWLDLAGAGYDYGFTFVNLEAVYHGLANADQAASIFDWLDGRRIVEGDTSTGADIYHWRFAPCATTRRNIRDYVWAWRSPEAIPWGGQVQDGGAVLGFSYHDLMARLRVLGPDSAWARLREILAWFGEVQAGGGYRAYYAADPSRGTLQGGGPAGGLGLDREFLESVLVPQIMLYGFLGCEPHSRGLTLRPNLPSEWPDVSVTRVHAQTHVLDISATREAVRLHVRRTDGAPFELNLPSGTWSMVRSGGQPEIIRAAQDAAPVRLTLIAGESIVWTRVPAE